MIESNNDVVLHVTESFGAGTATAIMQFATAVPEARHHLLRRERVDSLASVPNDLFESIHSLPSGPRAFAAIRAVVREVDPSVVHCHSSIGGALTRLSIRSRRARPTVYSPHCYAFQRRDIPFSMRALYAVLESMLSWNTGLTAACSEHEAELARHLNPRAAVQFIPNAAVAPVSAINNAPGAGSVVTTGRIGSQKDPGFFLKVVRAARRLDPDIRFSWLGSGDAALESRLTTEGVSVRGWSPHPWDAVPEGSVYLHSAAWEGFPFAVLEAHARRLPIVARAIPSFSSAPRSWVSPSPEVLAERVTRLMKDDSARQENRLEWLRALGRNDAEHQRYALLRAYRSGVAA